MEPNCVGACHPEHAQAPCLAKGSPAATAAKQNTQSPSTGHDVHSLKGLLNPEEAHDLTPSTSAVCPNLPVSPRSQSSNLRPSGLVSWGRGRRESSLAGSSVVQPAQLTGEMAQFPNSESMLPVDLGTPKKDGQP